MREPKHTQGPWVLSEPDYDKAKSDYEENGPGEHEDDPAYVAISGDGWDRFAKVVVCVGGEPDEAGIANARMIAAAPVLLAACKSAASLLRRLGGTNHDPEYSELLAAIAAAEGATTQPHATDARNEE